MKQTILLGGTILILAAATAIAGDSGDELYRSNELSFDVFGTGSIGKYTIDHLSGSRIRHNGRLGAGAGVSYYITRNFGVGVDGYSENLSGSLVDSASANLLLRFPLGESGLAPYALGGGGYQFDQARTGFVQAGGGVEYRFNSNVGLFTDIRMVVPGRTKYFGLARLGMRFPF